MEELKSMAIRVNNIKLPVSEGTDAIAEAVAKKLDIPKDAVRAVRLVRQSLDARKKNDVHFNMSAVVQLDTAAQAHVLKRGDADVQPFTPPEPYMLRCGDTPVRGRIPVIGLGPAGLFAAYALAKAGYQPLVIERGRPMAERTGDVERFWSTGALLPNSNVMFGEGGAGAFSDGKLTTRSKDARADVVLDTLCRFGAPQDITYKAKPHIGTDLLRVVVGNLRKEIEKLGGEVRFCTQLTGIEETGGALCAIRVEQNGQSEKIPCEAAVLAIGQGARDTYEMLLRSGMAMQPKAFAVGLRIEHPQSLIDRAQLGELAGSPHIGAAEYRLTGKSGNRGVYSFCMCPGGFVVAAASQEKALVVNGMSYHARNGKNANAAIVVQVGPEDFGTEPLAGMRFQQMLEQKAYQLGGGGFVAPAQRVEDFVNNRKTTSFGDVTPTYRPGVTEAALDQALPPFVTRGIQDGIRAFAGQLKGFDLPDAVLTGVESRTSAPLRILRDENGEALLMKGLYPVGEGAGYAGGIVSAAVDGLHAAERIAMRYKPGAEG